MRERVAVKFGGQTSNLQLVNGDAGAWATSVMVDIGSTDICVISAAPPEEFAGHLHDCSARILEEPAERVGALGTVFFYLLPRF
jgi:hypothetical protein